MSEDRTAEFRSRVEELDSRHDKWLRKAQLAFGRMLVRSCRFAFMRWLIACPFAWLSSWFIVERGLCGVEPGVKVDVLDIAENWIKIPTFIRMPFVIEEASDERVVITWPECAIGFEDPSCLPACETACRIDIETVRRLGGRLKVTDNLLEGAPACRFEITIDRLREPPGKALRGYFFMYW